jgi:hypothetical protein
MKRKITIELGNVTLSNTRSDEAFVDDGIVALDLCENGNIVREELVNVLDLINTLKDYLYVTVRENDE